MNKAKKTVRKRYVIGGKTLIIEVTCNCIALYCMYVLWEGVEGVCGASKPRVVTE